jgi:DNA-binding beta-propeller fold protein YncE
MKHYSDRNFTTGTSGLIAVDKKGNEVLFLDPESYNVIASIKGFALRVHELLISEDHTRAFVPIYGDGIHGNNPNPGHLIAVIDLIRKRHIGDFSVAPYEAPHGMRWGSRGQLYCICENSGVVVEMNPDTGVIVQVLEVGSNKGHRIEVLPDGSKLYSETEEDAFLAILDLSSQTGLKKLALPSELDGLGMSPDGRTILVVDAEAPRLYVVDTTTDSLQAVITLEHHEKAAQIVRYSPCGEFIVVTSHEEPLGTILDRNLEKQQKLKLGKGPMDMGFAPDGDTVLIANQDDGTITVVNLRKAEVVKTIKTGTGVESLSFY